MPRPRWLLNPLATALAVGVLALFSAHPPAAGVLLTSFAINTWITFGRDWKSAFELRRQEAIPPPRPLRRQLSALARRGSLPSPDLWVEPGWGSQIATMGIRRPVITIDGGALQALSEAGRDGFLAHELGHIAHHDVIVEVISRVMADFIVRLSGLLAVIHPAGLLVPLLLDQAAKLGLCELLRLQERKADDFSASLLGAAPLAIGLQELTRYDHAGSRLFTALARANEIRSELSPAAQLKLLALEGRVAALMDSTSRGAGILEHLGDLVERLLPDRDSRLGADHWWVSGDNRSKVSHLLATHLPPEERLARLPEDVRERSSVAA